MRNEIIRVGLIIYERDQYYDLVPTFHGYGEVRSVILVKELYLFAYMYIEARLCLKVNSKAI